MLKSEFTNSKEADCAILDTVRPLHRSNTQNIVDNEPSEPLSKGELGSFEGDSPILCSSKTTVKPNPFKENKYSYFFTINISPKQKLMCKKYDIGKRKVIRANHQWGDLLQTEQHLFLQHVLNSFNNYISQCDINYKYHYFFEQTRRGELHVHGRVGTEYLQHMKDLKVLLCQNLGLPATLKYLIDIKKYDHLKWNEYENKTAESKTYQTTSFKDMKNI